MRPPPFEGENAAGSIPRPNGMLGNASDRNVRPADRAPLPFESSDAAETPAVSRVAAAAKLFGRNVPSTNGSPHRGDSRPPCSAKSAVIAWLASGTLHTAVWWPPLPWGISRLDGCNHGALDAIAIASVAEDGGSFHAPKHDAPIEHAYAGSFTHRGCADRGVVHAFQIQSQAILALLAHQNRDHDPMLGDRASPARAARRRANSRKVLRTATRGLGSSDHDPKFYSRRMLPNTHLAIGRFHTPAGGSVPNLYTFLN